MTTALATQTPVEIDTQLAELYLQEQQARQVVMFAVEHIHTALGERKQYQGRRRVWPTTHAEAIRQGREKADVEVEVKPWQTSVAKTMADYDAAMAAVEKIEQAQAPLEAEYGRRRWSRFFTVRQHNGHIHSSMNCSTCNNGSEPTVFGWNPELSGLTEREAVAAKGPNLCTVCFPSAPVEWTKGSHQTAEEAAADGKCINRDGTNYRRLGMSLIGDCGACGARGVAATNAGLRKHVHERLQLEAERAARLNDPKLIGTPPGDVLRVDGDVIRTVRSAEIAYVDAMFWAAFRVRHHPDADPHMAARDDAKVAQLVEALAAKAGTTAEAVVAQLAPRVARKFRELQ